jgi:class 3 adenylate cyclase
MERRLAAILLTDMVGYSRLMELDEEGTIARQRSLSMVAVSSKRLATDYWSSSQA